jgi:gluconate 5-dehydrogenase
MAENPLFSLSGRIALVTGASRGLGLAMAEGLAEAGATVVLNGRDASVLAERADALAKRGLSACVAAFDVTDEAAAHAAVARIVAEQGSLDILIANAGIHRAHRLGQWRSEDWRTVMNTNLDACFLLAQQAAMTMIPRRYGRIIFTASLTGLMGRATIAAYCAAKAGLAGLMRSLAAELGEHGVTCNAIAPGYFETDMSAKMRGDPAAVERIVNRTPLRRWGKPHDLAGVAVFLASPAASFITGQQIVVDGGMGIAL